MVGSSSDHSHISVANSVLTLKATSVSGQPPSTSDPYPAIHYFSGAIHAKEQVNVDGTNAVGYQVEGEFSAPTAVGTWPACKHVALHCHHKNLCLHLVWLTAVSGWPVRFHVYLLALFYDSQRSGSLSQTSANGKVRGISIEQD